METYDGAKARVAPSKATKSSNGVICAAEGILPEETLRELSPLLTRLELAEHSQRPHWCPSVSATVYPFQQTGGWTTSHSTLGEKRALD
jgi:hypothetical protein